MKKQGLGLFLTGLVFVIGLDASAGKEAIEAAKKEKQETAAAQADRPEIPYSVTQAIYSNRPEEIIDWLDANPANKNGVEAEKGRSILVMVSMYIAIIGIDPLHYLVAMKPNALIKDRNGKDAFDSIFAMVHYSKDELRKARARAVIALMVEQGADIEVLLQRAQVYYVLTEEDNRKKTSFILWVIDLLQQEKDKLGLKAAKENLVSQGCLVPDVGTLLAPSNPHLLAIKHAIEDNDEAKLKAALENNKWLEIKDQTGYTPFLYAAYINKPDMMRYLIKQGADVNAKTKDGVGATYFGDYQKLIDETRVALKKASQELFDAINADRFTDVDKLPDKRTIINMRDDKGRTPLMLAAELGREGMIDLLQLVTGADVWAQDERGNTALHIAIDKGHYLTASGILHWLISTNKNGIELKNKEGYTAYQLAMKRAADNKNNEDFKKLMEAFKTASEK